MRKCRKVTSLHKVLNQLPKDLHEQYTRDLAKIPDEDAEDALKLLQWLAFSQCKLRLEEAVDLLAVDLKAEYPVFNIRDRTIPPSQIVAMCGSLVRADLDKAGHKALEDDSEATTLTTSHTTVLDFLCLNAIKIGSQPEVTLTKASANVHMAETCLGYLHTLFDSSTTFNEETLREYPSALLCAEYWPEFYREAIYHGQQTVQMARINRMIIRLLDSKDATSKWAQLCSIIDSDESHPVNFDTTQASPDSPIYLAALLQLPDIMKHYIRQGADMNYITDQGYGTPLVAASALGDEQTVAILLANGADPTLAGHHYWGCPLAAAVDNDRVNVVKILLSHERVNINCVRCTKAEEKPLERNNLVDEDSAAESLQREEFSCEQKITITATNRVLKTWREASVGSDKIAEQEKVGDEEDNAPEEQVMTDKDEDEDVGFDFREQEAADESMVYIAAAYNSPESLTLLLEANADPNIKGGPYHTALQAACAWGRESIVGLLLDHGAKANIYGGYWGSALAAACSIMDSTTVAKRLINAGNNVNHEGGTYKCALYVACQRQKAEMVDLLLEHGAAPNVAGCGDYDNPLQLACYCGDETIVQSLLRHGADFNLRGGLYDNCLQAACRSGKESVVIMLLEAGMSVNEKGGQFAYPLVRAVAENQERIARILLGRGANPNLEVRDTLRREGSTAIQYAETISMIDVLVSHGAAIDHQSPGLWSPLSQAIWRGDEGMVQWLLENGANPEQSHNKNCSPMRVACRSRSIKMAELLIDHGANISAPIELSTSGSALHIAAELGDVGMVAFLISRGADVHLVHWQTGTPLMAACMQHEPGVVQLLRQDGATHGGTNLVGHNALLCAVAGERIDHAEQLLSLGFDPYIEDKRGCNALHYAACAAKVGTLKAFIERGLDVNVVDNNGWSPLHWAAASSVGSAEVIRVLLEANADKSLIDKQGRTALDLAYGFAKKVEAFILKTGEPIFDLLHPVNNEITNRTWWNRLCDGCYAVGPLKLLPTCFTDLEVNSLEVIDTIA